MKCLLAAVSVLLAACNSRAVDWQSMDTAPHDGTVIVIRCEHGADSYEVTMRWSTVDFSPQYDAYVKAGATRKELGDPISTEFHTLDGNGSLWGGPLPGCRWHRN